jgi:hypothetical protein
VWLDSVRVIQSDRVAYLVKSCVACGSHEITTRWPTERIVTITCAACRRIMQIEFDPPAQPGIRGRIEVLFDPDQDDDGDDDASAA